MVSAKNISLKFCIKCAILLTDKNQHVYDKKRSYYVCKECRKKKNTKYYLSTNDEYKNKQRGRFRMKRSAVIFYYGNECKQCGENDYTKLTIKNIGDTQSNKNLINYLYDNMINKDSYQVTCYNCKKQKAYKDKYALSDKKKVIEHYGNECQRCKEDRIEKLTINHSKNMSGIKMYRWIIKNNYLVDFDIQVFCFNCKNQNLAGVNAWNASVLDGSESESESESRLPKLL